MIDYCHFAMVDQNRYPIYLNFHPQKNLSHNHDGFIMPIPIMVNPNHVHSEMNNLPILNLYVLYAYYL